VAGAGEDDQGAIGEVGFADTCRALQELLDKLTSEQPTQEP
jgi:hypothetical protein